jgi:hypothetical protein
LNCLKTVDYGDGQTQSYAFDPMGNRLSKVDSSNGMEGYSYNAANMLLTRAVSSKSGLILVATMECHHTSTSQMRVVASRIRLATIGLSN